jgi:predicted enzyme related to lactoylglutathione lyase
VRGVSLSRVALVSVPVSDQDRALAFYRDVLGMEIRSDHGFDAGMRWLTVGFSGQDTSLILVTWFPSMPAGSARGMVIETDDVEAERARLQSHGVEVGAVETAPWGRFVQIADPDGNGIIVQQSNRP